VVALLATSDFFGEGCLAGQPLRMATVSTLEESVIARISKADVVRVIHEEPSFAELFISHLLARNIRVEEDLVDQLFNSSEKRLARVLLLLANFGKDGKPEPVIAKISQENTRRDDRHDEIACQFFHEQVSTNWALLVTTATSKSIAPC
jgi:CRP/FNR family transcriptional regulator, cyclic AMP receptor protein